MTTTTTTTTTVKAQWADWSSWSNCSVDCGQGFSYRKRVCLQSKCDGSSNEIKFCISKIGCQDSIANEVFDFSLYLVYFDEYVLKKVDYVLLD
jgi:hypothetical protein